MTTLPASDGRDTRSVTDNLLASGAVVMKNMLADADRERILAELKPHVDAAQVDTDVSEEDFYPGYTRRITAIVARSPATHERVLDPAVGGVLDNILLPNCHRYQLHVGSALVVGPGARSQVLHREDDAFPYFKVPRPDMIIAFMWALSDFTAENGATLIVPGSHRWEAGREATPEEVVPAAMKAGDVLAWMGGTLHGAGENTTDGWRHGLFCSYSLGWLRQEENQFVDAPLSFAKTLSPDLRAMLGYKMHGGSLGFYDPTVFEEEGA